MTTDDIQNITVIMIDKENNGYVAPISEEFYSLIAQIAKFIKLDKSRFEITKIEDLIKENGC